MDLKNLQAKVAAVSEIYASNNQIQRSADWAVLKLAEEVGELTQAHLKLTGRARTESTEDWHARFSEELADVLGQVLVLAELSNVDLLEAIDRKWLRWLPKKSSPV